jgi:hypothetical protein
MKTNVEVNDASIVSMEIRASAFRRAFALFLVGIFSTMSGWTAGSGEAAGSFLVFPTDARSAALGEGGVALAQGAAALSLNPAAMVATDRLSVQMTHSAYVSSSHFENVALSRRLSGASVLGFGFRYFSVGRIGQTNLYGDPVGDLSPNDMALSAGYARDIVFGSLGASVKYVRSKLLHTATALSLDLGFRTPPLYFERYRFALTASNLIGSLKYDQESSPLPRTFTLGGSYQWSTAMDLTADAALPLEGKAYASLGIERRLRLREPWSMALRGGYTSRHSGLDGALAGWTLGLGIRHGRLTFDYAFLPYGDVASTHWLTIGGRI